MEGLLAHACHPRISPQSAAVRCWKQEVEEGHERQTAELARQLSDARAELAAERRAAAVAAEAGGKALQVQQGAAAEAAQTQRQQAAEVVARLRARLAEAAGERLKQYIWMLQWQVSG
jgi:hypothetical protein